MRARAEEATHGGAGDWFPVMTIKNEMEFLVRNEVRRQREMSGKGRDEICWCLLCEADITALALNLLPPRYCHGQNYGFAQAQGFETRVREAVGRAVQKVSRRPKHRPGRPEQLAEDVRVQNFAQTIGSALVGTALAQGEGACACEQCRADALAYALNRYPPKYGVSGGGRESYQAQYADFIRHEVAQVLGRAARIVHAHPHH